MPMIGIPMSKPTIAQLIEEARRFDAELEGYVAHGICLTASCAICNNRNVLITQRIAFAANNIMALCREVERLQAIEKRLVEMLLAQAVNETKDTRRRLLESENIPPELWEMRLK